MASGTADLQRDLGGALMTSIFGALLAAGYASAMAGVDSHTTQNTQAQLQLSFASAENVASHHPAEASQITAAAQQSFVDGDNWAYIAAMVAVLIGMALVFRFFPKKQEEEALRTAYHAHDQGETADAGQQQPTHVPRPGEGPAVIPGHVSPPEGLT